MDDLDMPEICDTWKH